jgi:hypothetical protein
MGWGRVEQVLYILTTARQTDKTDSGNPNMFARDIKMRHQTSSSQVTFTSHAVPRYKTHHVNILKWAESIVLCTYSQATRDRKGGNIRGKN